MTAQKQRLLAAVKEAEAEVLRFAMVNDYDLVELTFAKLTATIEAEFKEPPWPRFRKWVYTDDVVSWESPDHWGVYADGTICRRHWHEMDEWPELTSSEAEKLLNPQ